MHEPCLSGLIIWDIHRTDRPIFNLGCEDRNNFIVRIGKRIFLDEKLPSPFLSYDSAEVIYLSKQSGSLLVGFLLNSQSDQPLYSKLLGLFINLLEFFLADPLHDDALVGKEAMIADMFQYMQSNSVKEVLRMNRSELIKELRKLPYGKDLSPACQKLCLTISEQLSFHQVGDDVKKSIIKGDIWINNPLTSDLMMRCDPSVSIGLTTETRLDVGKYCLTRYMMRDRVPFRIELFDDRIEFFWREDEVVDVQAKEFKIAFKCDGTPSVTVSPSTLSHRVSFKRGTLVWHFSHIVPSTLYTLNLKGAKIAGPISVEGRLEGMTLSGLQLQDMSIHQPSTGISAMNQTELVIRCDINPGLNKVYLGAE